MMSLETELCIVNPRKEQQQNIKKDRGTKIIFQLFTMHS